MQPALPTAERRRNPIVGCFQTCLSLLVALGLSAVLVVALTYLTFRVSPLSVFSSMPVSVAVSEITQSAIEDLGEDPAVTPASPAPRYPIDPSVPQPLVVPLVKALDLMRGTPDGEKLFNLLVDNDVLISVEDLSYNAGFTASTWTKFGWKESNIVISSDAVRSRTVDVLAAILVHEATHAERAIDEKACFYADDCETLSNGVDITEEIIAHSAEAQFWEELYGDDGKDIATGAATGENSLLDAYLSGTAKFSQFVRDLRGDTREGEGVVVS